MNVVVEARDVRALRRRPAVPDRRALDASAAADDVPPMRGAVDLKCHLAGHELVARTVWQQVCRSQCRMFALTGPVWLSQMYHQTC